MTAVPSSRGAELPSRPAAGPAVTIPRTARVRALLPASLVALFTLWAGTLDGGVTAHGAFASQAAILTFAWLAAAKLQDPLALGGAGRWLPAALLAQAALSWWASPVARAGAVGLTLLPAYLLSPAAASRCWNRPASRRLGLDSLCLLVGIVGLVALVSQRRLDLPRAALPLGHHTLLAGWLLLLLPLAVLPALRNGRRRWLAVVASGLGAAALWATGSLLGGLGATAQLLVAAVWWRRGRPWLAAVAAVSLLALAPRLLRIGEGLDPSALARSAYLAAGWAGFSARPILGWGAGAVPWTVAQFVRPIAGVQPPSEVIGDLHSLPVQIAYELGLPGLLLSLAVIVVFARRRLREAKRDETGITGAAALGLLGGGVAALGSAPVSVPALPLTAAVVAGLAMPGSEHSTPPLGTRRPTTLALYFVVAAVALWPLARAHRHYDQARHAASDTDGLAALRRAAELDPGFPLYRARAAWLESQIEPVTASAARQAYLAARQARGLAPLWLAAGHLGHLLGEPWAHLALERAHRLDPLSPLIAFHLMMAHPENPFAVELGSQAVEAEPRLASAQFWQDHPQLARRVAERTGTAVPRWLYADSGEPLALTLTMDREPALAFSLYAFRRSPWPARLAPVMLLTVARGDSSDAAIGTQPGLEYEGARSGSPESAGAGDCRVQSAAEAQRLDGTDVASRQGEWMACRVSGDAAHRIASAPGSSTPRPGSTTPPRRHRI